MVGETTGYLHTQTHLGQAQCLGHGTGGKQSGSKNASSVLSSDFTTALSPKLKSRAAKSEGAGEAVWSVSAASEHWLTLTCGNLELAQLCRMVEMPTCRREGLASF